MQGSQTKNNMPVRRVKLEKGRMQLEHALKALFASASHVDKPGTNESLPKRVYSCRKFFRKSWYLGILRLS